MSLAEFFRLDGYEVTETFKHLDSSYVLVAVEATEEVMHCSAVSVPYRIYTRCVQKWHKALITRSVLTQ